MIRFSYPNEKKPLIPGFQQKLAGLFAIILCLTACAPQPLPLEDVLPTATASPMPTQTIVWFPPTATPTQQPTRAVTPTPNMMLDLGALLVEDGFSKKTGWTTINSAAGNVAFGNSDLTLAVASPRTTLQSLRSGDLFSDFYLEITGKVSLCRAEDSYGVLARASSEYNAYRLWVRCDGNLRLERLRNGEVVILKDWTPSGQVRPGAPVSNRIGILASGQTLRVFIDDVFQFEARDPVWQSGTVGVLARSNGDTSVSVSFQDLKVFALDSAPISTATPVSTP
jgi:hypothetical protein